MTAERVQVLIIGAGPAGAMAAWTLATAGVRDVLVVEAHRLPRAKLCSGVISTKTLRWMQAVWVPFPAQAVIGASRHLVWRVGGRERLFVAPNDLLFVDRAQWDAGILAAAQAPTVRAPVTVQDGVRAVAYDRATRRVRLADGTWIRADWVIGADGTAGISTRAVHGQRVPQITAYEAQWAEVPIRPAVYLDWDLPGGYGWVFPKWAGVAVGGASAQAGWTPSRRAYLDQLAQGAGVHLPAGPVPGHGIPSHVPWPPTNGHCLLVGDAGGWADPLIGEGIPYALWTGWAAARALLTPDPARTYTRWARRLGAWQRPLRWVAALRQRTGAAWLGRWIADHPRREAWVWASLIARPLPVLEGGQRIDGEETVTITAGHPGG